MSLFRNRKLFETSSATPQSLGAVVSTGNPQTPVSQFPVPNLSRRVLPELQEVHRVLRELQILLHTRRLYHHTHPKSLENLETTHGSLQRLVVALNGFEIRIEHDGLVVPKLSESPLPDPKSELKHLHADFQLAGIRDLVVLRQFHVGELDTLAQLIRAALLKSDESAKKKRSSWWTAKLLEYGVEGIQVNSRTDRKLDSVLTSLIAALVSFGGNSAVSDTDAPITAPTTENLADVLRLIARLTPPLESARGLSPEHAARAIHGALADAKQETVHLLLNTISQHGPDDSEKPQPYLVKLSETIILETLSAELSVGALAARDFGQ